MRLAQQRLALLAIILGAFALRVWRLDYQELRGDEAFGYFFSLPSPAIIVGRTIDLQEPHPIASYWLQHGWLALAGHSEFALRFTSLWWSTLSVALIAQVARSLGLGTGAELLGALLCALSPYALWHAQDARMYSMSLALTLAAALAALRWVASPGWRWAAFYAVTAWLALHTHYYAAFVIASLALFVLVWCVRAERQLYAAPWLALQGLVGLLYVPWLLTAGTVLTGYRGNGDSPGLVNAFVRMLSVMSLGEAARVETGPARGGVALIVAATVAFGLWLLVRSDKRGRHAALLLAFYALMPLAAIWLSAQARPIFDERYLLATAPPLYLLMAVALAHALPKMWRSRPGLWPVLLAALVLLVVGLFQYYANPQLSKSRGWRELAQRLDLLAGGAPVEAVRLVQNYPDPTLWYYYRGDAPHLVLPPAAHDSDGALREVAQMASAGVQRAVLVVQPNPAWDASGSAQTALAEKFAPVAALQVGSWPLHIYAAQPPKLDGPHVVYADGLRLSGAALDSTTVAPGGVLVVHLDWDAAAAPSSERKQISLQMLDSSGHLVAQTDTALVTGDSSAEQIASYGILAPEDLAPGPYTLSLVLYDPIDEDAPRLLTSDGQDAVPLSEISAVLPGLPAKDQERNAGPT
jgi:4-amino-4-deoxy-L-arabinose transferase-like glycosyltransferase